MKTITLGQLDKKKKKLKTMGEKSFDAMKNEKLEKEILLERKNYLQNFDKEHRSEKWMKHICGFLIFLFAYYSPTIFGAVDPDKQMSIIMGAFGLVGWFLLYAILTLEEEKTQEFDEFYSEEVEDRYYDHLEELVLTKDEIKPLYATLLAYYGSERLALKMEELKKQDDEIGSYYFLEKLYSRAIRDEKARRKAVKKGNKNLIDQVEVLLKK